MIRGSRLLNDNGTVLGLNVFDLIGAIVVLVLFAHLLGGTSLEFLALPVAALALIALIPIRLKYRRKIIRDFCRFWLNRIFNKGRIRVGKYKTFTH
jgi:hypothetical protein